MGDFLKLPPSEAGEAMTGQDAAGSAFARDYPCLYEWMTMSAWENGKVRVPSSVTLFTEAGKWKCCFSDKDGNKVTFVSAWTVEDLLRALEDGLLGNTLDWRRARSLPTQPVKK